MANDGDVYYAYRAPRRQGFLSTMRANVVIPNVSTAFRSYPPGQQTVCETCGQRATLEELHVTRFLDGQPKELIQFVTRCWAPKKKRCPVIVEEVPFGRNVNE